MRLDRNSQGHQKYALLKLRQLAVARQAAGWEEVERAIAVLENAGVIDYGPVGSDSEFFVMRLKDIFAHAGLGAYARAAVIFDAEYAADVDDLIRRSGFYHPSGGKYPD